MIKIRQSETDRLLELGGGDRPVVHPTVMGGHDVHIDIRTCLNAEGRQTTDIEYDINKLPLPLSSGEFDGVVSVYCLEHTSWRVLPNLLKEIYRVTKPGGTLVLVLPNTEAQARYILDGRAAKHKDGLFVEASRILFGDQNYAGNYHSCWLSPALMTELLTLVGYTSVTITAAGELNTDMVVEATKPVNETQAPEGPKAVFLKEIPRQVAEHERTGGTERAAVGERTEGRERAAPREGTVLLERSEHTERIVELERAADTERFVSDERAAACERTAPKERAANQERTVPQERAVAQERTVPRERAEPPERTMAEERAAPQERTVEHDRPEGAGPAAPSSSYDPARTFDRRYFDGGKDGGGYQLYLDFPCHEVTARHVLARKPKSVLELGCGRGYVLKRIQDAGVPGWGIDISKHCSLSRVCDRFNLWDLTSTPWVLIDHSFAPADNKIDLCLSIAVLEHIPEDKLPAVIREMQRTCRRGLHGIFFTNNPTDNDKTKLTLKPKEWWLNLFHEVAPGWPCEIVNKDDLENGDFPPDYFKGDGKVKLNLGCAKTMFHFGWTNVDCLDLGGWAGPQGYSYVKTDLRNPLPFKTDETALIYSAHCLEHLSYAEGRNLLKECRRVIRADGCMRIIVPDAKRLTTMYAVGNVDQDFNDLPSELAKFDELNPEVAACPTAAGKLWSLLGTGHAAAYDCETLSGLLEEAGWIPLPAEFRLPGLKPHEVAIPNQLQLLRETLDVLPSLSLYMDALPRIEK